MGAAVPKVVDPRRFLGCNVALLRRPGFQFAPGTVHNSEENFRRLAA